MDNSIYKSFNEYATFDNEQRAWIKLSASEYQKWHRKTELPQYAILFNDVASMLATQQSFSNDSVARIFESLESFARRSFENSPFPQSVPFLRQITDEQVRQIESTFAEQNKRQLERIQEQSAQPDNNRRIDKVAKRLSKIGLVLNDDQRRIIDEGMSQYIGNREDRVVAWQIWQERFVDLLNLRNQPVFDELMQEHINQYQVQMELQYPERSAKNREIAIATVTRLITSLTAGQREDIVSTLRTSSTILIAMGRSKQTELL